MIYSFKDIIVSPSLASDRVLSPLVPSVFEESLGCVYLRQWLLVDVRVSPPLL